MNDRSGQQLGNYRLIRQLGKGGFAVVYLGEHVHLKTLAAIKVLHQVQLTSEEEAKFRAEARTIANLKHAHIIRVLDYGIQESCGTPFLVMDYAPGETLRQRYAPGTRLSPQQILPYVTQVASALQYAHDCKVIHRDVKPENMLLDENDRVRLSDFGIAVVYEALHTLDKSGTPPYMAPEQFLGRPVPASDQYSLGIVVYEWLCGARPFNGALADLLHQHENEVPPLLREQVSSLSPAIETVIQRSLAKNPEDRYASIVDFACAFQEACQLEQADSGMLRTILIPSSVQPCLSAAPAQAERARPTVATPPTHLPMIWNVPHRRNMFFTGRKQVLEALHDAFFSGKAAAQIQAISGLSGIGKTQVALEYAYRYHRDYQAILWLRGDTREKMLNDIVALANVLHLQVQQNGEQPHSTEAVKSWLRKNTRWLLIVDNIEDLKLVRTLLPATAPGHILLTTRTQTTGNIAQRIDLEKMTQEEGALLLLRRTRMVAQDATLQDANPADCQEARELAKVLDGLPLALDQAGAYIEEAGCNLVTYLCRYRAGQMKLLGMRGGFAFDHPASVAGTFAALFEKVEKISPTAMELFRFCAFLHSEGIPEELIVRGASELGPTLQCVATDPLSLDETIATLRRFSLVSRHADTSMLSVHSLVQIVLQNRMHKQERLMWAERTVRAVNRVLPDISDFSAWQRCQLYMPHVQKCVSLIEEWKMVSPEAMRVLEQSGAYLQIQAQYKQAKALFEHAAEMRALLAEVKPTATVAALGHLFWDYYYQGQYTQAEQPVKEALKILERTASIEQQFVAVYLGYAAHLFFQQGKYSQAEEYFLQALMIYEKRLGLQHPSVVCTFNGLGNVAFARGKYDLAEKFFWDALNIWKKMPEPQHPLMGDTLNSLARLLLARGKYTQAEHYLQQERMHREQTLRYPHPALAYNLTVQAVLYIMQGKYKEAEPLLKQAWTMLEQSVGLQHPIAGYTLDAFGRLAYLQGDYVAAERFLQRAQGIREQTLGIDHPDLYCTINNLADVYMKQSKLSMAEELYKDVLAARTRLLGAEHPAVAQTLQSMAQLSYAQGQYIDAEQLYKRVITIREKVLKSEHPEIAHSLYGLALLYYWKWKRFDLAELFLQRALAIYLNAQLLDHPDMAQFLKTYASLLLVLKRKPEAVKAMIHAKTILESA
jgi:serine/threonine protein kinase/tetratricopeptide (TPR) repeat protein